MALHLCTDCKDINCALVQPSVLPDRCWRANTPTWEEYAKTGDLFKACTEGSVLNVVKFEG